MRHWQECVEEGSRLAVGTHEIVKLDADSVDEGHEARLAEVAHDLKAPLSVISLEISMIEARLQQPELYGSVLRIQQNIEHVDRMIDNLLRAERTGLSLHIIELRDLVDQFIDRTVASTDRARVVVEGDHGIWLPCDELAVQRVLGNLVRNALTYCRGAVVVRIERRDRVARVSVIDRGPGLSPADMAIVFDRSQRGASASGHAGSGLGLYISKQLVEAHAGTIGVDSIPGVGSTFYFELPRRP